MKMKKLLSSALLGGVLALSCLFGAGVIAKAQNKELKITKVETDGSADKSSTKLTVTLNDSLPDGKTFNKADIELKKPSGATSVKTDAEVSDVIVNGTDRKKIDISLTKVKKTENNVLVNFAGGVTIDGYDIVTNDSIETTIFYKDSSSNPGQVKTKISITKVEQDGKADTTTTKLTLTLDNALPNEVKNVLAAKHIELKAADNGDAVAEIKDVMLSADKKIVTINLKKVNRTADVIVNLKDLSRELGPYNELVPNTQKTKIYLKNSAPTPAPNPNPTPNQNTGSSGGGFIAPQPSTETSKVNTETKNNNTTKDTSNKTEDKKVEKQTESNDDDDDISSGNEEVNTTVKVNGTENLKAKVSSKKIEDALDNEQSVVVKNSKQRIEIGTKALKEITKNGKAFNLEIKKTANTANVALKEKKAFDFSINKKMLNLKNAVTVSLPYSSGNAKVFVIGKDGKAKQINGVKYDKKTKTLKFKTKTIGKIVIGK